MVPADNPHKRPGSIMPTHNNEQERAKNHKDIFDRDAITKENSTASPLLRLPPELRNEIYALVLVGGKFLLEDETKAPVESTGNRASLLLTCRQINAEASGAEYRSHTLRLGSMVSIYDLYDVFGENGQFREHALLEDTHVVEIPSCFCDYFSTQMFFLILDGSSVFDRTPSSIPKRRMLLDLVPNLKLVKVYDYHPPCPSYPLATSNFMSMCFDEDKTIEVALI